MKAIYKKGKIINPVTGSVADEFYSNGKGDVYTIFANNPKEIAERNWQNAVDVNCKLIMEMAERGIEV